MQGGKKGTSTMSCIDHSSAHGGMVNLSADVGPIVQALYKIAESFKDQRITVETPEPDVVELSPVINVSPPVVNVAPPQVTVQPCPIPDINVHPSETVIMTQDGAKVSPKIDVILPMKPFYIGISIPSVLVLIDIILRVIK